MRRHLALGLVLGPLVAALYACAAGDDTEPLVTGEVDGGGGSKDAGKTSALPDASTEEEEDAAVEEDSAAPVDGGIDSAAPDAGGDAGQDAGPTLLGDAGTFMVVRVGAPDGGALSSAAAPVALEERRFGDGNLVRTIAMPVAEAGAQKPLTLRGTATTEGTLTTSGDGAFVVLAGYAAVPGTADVAGTASATTPRVVARVAKNGAIDTSTLLDAAFSAKSVRAAATADGTAFWVSGENGNGSTGGIYYVAQGTTGGTQILATPENLRAVGLFGGQLYADTQSGSGGNTLRIFSVGAGAPTTAMQTGTQLPGITNANTTPHGFVMLDRDAAVAGVDVMYVADTRGLATGGGVQKWKLAGGTWSLATTFKNGLTAAPVNVAAKPVGMDVVVVCVTLDNPAKVVRFVDDGVNLDPVGVTLATGTANAAQYRGVAVAPE